MADESVIIIQARMGSTRLPGKVLEDLGGRPLLGLMIDRLAVLGLPIVVATSELTRDDPITDVARGAGADVFRGSEADVLGRLATAARLVTSSHIVRMTADCPLADPALVDRALSTARTTGADYVSNSLVRTFPDGLDVEVMSRDALLGAARDSTAPLEREHVTPYLYRRPDRFHLEAFVDHRCMGHERWTVDTPHDLAVIREIISLLPTPHAGWEEILEIVGPAQPAPVLKPIVDNGLAPRSTPGRRTWYVRTRGALRGWIGIQVEGPGRATVEGDLEDGDRPAAIAALRDALRADFQVDDLVIRGDWTGQERSE